MSGLLDLQNGSTPTPPNTPSEPQVSPETPAPLPVRSLFGTTPTKIAPETQVSGNSDLTRAVHSSRRLETQKKLESYIESFRASFGAKGEENTQKSYAHDAQSLLKYLPDEVSDQLSETLVVMVREMLKDVRERNSPTTFARKCFSTKKFLKYIANKYREEFSPAAEKALTDLFSDRPKAERGARQRTLSTAEQEALIAYVSEEYEKTGNPTALVITKMFLETGLRLSELTSLRFDETYLLDPALKEKNPAQVRISRSKGNKTRYVPIKDDLKRLLAEYHNWRTAEYNKDNADDLRRGKFETEESMDYFFVSKWRKKLTRDNVQQMFAAIFKAVGIQNASVHTFRHTFISNYFSNNPSPDIPFLMSITGHSDIRTLLVYMHTVDLDAKMQEFVKS